jgi:hypothetical protein
LKKNIPGEGVHVLKNGWCQFGVDYSLCPDCGKFFLKEMKRHKNRLTEIVGEKAAEKVKKGVFHV